VLQGKYEIQAFIQFIDIVQIALQFQTDGKIYTLYT
jgi:hypothetical protein